MKYFLSMMFISVCFSVSAYAEVSTKNLAEFSPICHKVNSTLKDYAQQCECEKENFRWLLNNNVWSDTKNIYKGKTDHFEIENSDDLEPLSTLIVTVKKECFKNKKYLAPKAKDLKTKSKK